MNQSVMVATSAIVALALTAGELAANPSTSQPDLPLTIRNEEASRKLLDLLLPLDRRAAEVKRPIERKLAEGDINSGEAVAVSELAALAFGLQAYGEQLADRGEAAGHDFMRRAASYDLLVKRAVIELKKQNDFRADLAEQGLKSVHDANQSRLPALAQQAAGGQLESVEQDLLKILANMQRFTIWLESTSRYTEPFTRALDEVRGPLRQARAAQLAAAMETAIGPQDPGYDKLLADIEAAAVELKKGGHAPWAGKSYTGPELIEPVVAGWQAAHQRALRRRALELIRRGGDKANAPAEQVTTDDEAFAGKLRTAIAGLIAADAARVDAKSAGPLYHEYVQSLGRAALVTDRQALAAAVEPALKQLAAKDPALISERDSYAEATSDLLRWKRRVARARGLYLQQSQYLDLRGRLADAARNRPSDPALLADQEPSSFAALHGPSPNVLRRLQKELIGQPAATGDVLGLGGGKAIGRYEARVYVRLSFPIAPQQQAEAAALRFALLVTDKSPPLSVEASAALAAAQQDCYERVGGLPTEVYLEPLLSRFATLSDRSTGLTPPHEMPSEPLQSDLRSHVLARVDLAPHWVQHEYFVAVLVKAPPKPEN
jgi:hypothetical protein